MAKFQPSFSSSVPLDEDRVRDLGDFLFHKRPRYLPMIEIMAVDENEPLMAHKGSWCCAAAAGAMMFWAAFSAEKWSELDEKLGQAATASTASAALKTNLA